MSSVVFGFTTKPRNLLSALIRAEQGTPYSHVFIKMHVFERDLVFQATLPYVGLWSAPLFYAAESVVEEIEVPCSSAELIGMLQFCIDNCGKSYAYAKLFGILWKRWMADLGKNVKNPYDNGDKTEECAELGALALTKVLGLQTTDDLESVGPKWVHDQAAAMAKGRSGKSS